MQKFKVGDKVKILRKDNTFGWDQSMQQYVGTIHVLEDAYPNHKDVAGWDIEGWIWSENALELVEANTTIREFKVGDKVRCIDTSAITLSNDVVYEVRGTAAAPASGIPSIYLQGFPDHQWWYATRFELVEAVPEVKKYTVEEVLEAYWGAHDLDTSSLSIATTKAELDKRSDADYAKWLELKAKFG